MVLTLASRDAVQKYGLTARAKVLGMASASVAPPVMGIGPVPAVRKLLERLKISVHDFGVIGLSEVFAANCAAVRYAVFREQIAAIVALTLIVSGTAHADPRTTRFCLLRCIIWAYLHTPPRKTIIARLRS